MNSPLFQKSVNKAMKWIAFGITLETWINSPRQKDLHDNIRDLAKANRDLASLNKSQQEKIESLLLKIRESQNQNNDLPNQPNILHKESFNEESKILEAISQNTENKGKIAETIFKETKEFRNDITHNNVLGFLEDYIDAYKEYLSTLTLEQLACLANIIMLWMILSTINGLIITYYGNIIISRLKLEVKFPKLAKIILLRSKLSQKLIRLEIIYLYFLVLIGLGVNIYMFF